METHELDIAILPDGTVRMEVHGAKGPECEKYAALFQQILAGEVVETERTQEYYEASTGVTVNLRVTE